MATANNTRGPQQWVVADCVYKRRKKNGYTYLALVRVKGFKDVSKVFPTQAEAVEWVKAQKKELTKQRESGGARRPDLPKLTVGELIREFVADPTTQALSSVGTYVERLGWWTLHHGSERVLDFGVLIVREARASLIRGTGLRKTPEPATVNRYLAAMRRAWNWGRSAGLIPNERLWPEDVMLKEPKGRVRFLSDAELDGLRKAAVEVYGPQLFALTLVSIATGMRQSELLRLKWSDVDFKHSKVTILKTKNNESRSVYLPATAADTLQALRKLDVVSPVHVFVDPRDGKLFDKNKLRYRWKLARSAAKLTDFRWHDLRHSCASLLAQNGANLLEIGSVLGHKSPSATMRYAHLVQGAPVTGHTALDEKLSGK